MKWYLIVLAMFPPAQTEFSLKPFEREWQCRTELRRISAGPVEGKGELGAAVAFCVYGERWQVRRP